LGLKVGKDGVVINRSLFIKLTMCEISRFQQLLSSYHLSDRISRRLSSDDASASALSVTRSDRSKQTQDEQKSQFFSKGSLNPRQRKQRNISKGRKRKKPIFSFPELSVEMDTSQCLHKMPVKDKHPRTWPYVTDTDILYKFRTAFRSAIDVSTDVRDYTYLKEIAISCSKNFGSSLARARTSDNSSESNDSDTATHDHDDQSKGSVNATFQATRSWTGQDHDHDSESESITNNKMYVWDVRRNFSPDASGMEPGEPDAFVFEPKVNVLGEGTNMALGLVLGRLDLDKKMLPEKTHVLITDHLELVLKAFRTASNAMDDLL